MVWKRKVFAIATLALLAAILSGLMVSPALGQQPERVKVLIGFARQPGPAEQALVRGVGGRIRYTYHLVPAIAATVPEAAIDGLRRNPNVTNVDLDGQVWAIDDELDNTWGVKHIGAGTVHDGGNKGTGVKVAVLDTGIDTDHPDLSYESACSANFVENETLEDGHGHGTHVAGTVAALDDDEDEGVVGVAPGATLCIYKVLSDSGSGSYSDVIAALEQAVEDGVQVTNNSYGSSGDPGETVKGAFDNAFAAGILNVCAAGNSGNPPGKGDNVIYPARYESCIAVAATKQDDNRASFSSTGPDVELAAPGVAINSTLLGGGYGVKSGTSMASPHVAGTAALVWVAYPSWTNADVRSQLENTADDLGDPGRDTKYGYGLVDADEAAPDTTPPEPTHDVAVTSINVPSTVAKGEIVAVDVTVVNEGTFNEGTFKETFSLTLTDETDEVTIIGPATVSLAAGASTTITFDWDTTGSSLDDHLLKAEASVVEGETDTADNVKTATVSVVEKKALYVAIALDRDPPVTRGETVYIKVTVTDGTDPVEGAMVHITILTPKPISYGWDQTTDEYGVTGFEFTPKWSGEYTTWADASKEGYDSGSSERITFTVN